jgi:hypothetical protein
MSSCRFWAHLPPSSLLHVLPSFPLTHTWLQLIRNIRLFSVAHLPARILTNIGIIWARRLSLYTDLMSLFFFQTVWSASVLLVTQVSGLIVRNQRDWAPEIRCVVGPEESKQTLKQLNNQVTNWTQTHTCAANIRQTDSCQA